MPRVSIILPVYNSENEIARSINSVLNQTYRNFELIVIDDGSTDNTKDVLKQFNAHIKVRLFFQKNKGAPEARNYGLSLANGEYIAFQDSDDVWREDKLEKQVSIIESNPSCGLVYSDMLRILKNGESYYWNVPVVENNFVISPKTCDYQVFGIGMQTILVRSNVAALVGGFDTELPRFIDLDWFIRIAKVSKFIKSHEPLVQYYETDGISSDPTKAALARQILLVKYKKDIYIKKLYIANQFSKIALAYWKANDKTKGFIFAKKAFLVYPYSLKINLKLLILVMFSPEIKRILPKFINNKYW